MAGHRAGGAVSTRAVRGAAAGLTVGLLSLVALTRAVLEVDPRLLTEEAVVWLAVFVASLLAGAVGAWQVVGPARSRQRTSIIAALGSIGPKISELVTDVLATVESGQSLGDERGEGRSSGSGRTSSTRRDLSGIQAAPVVEPLNDHIARLLARGSG